jgi:hypothetical protein
MRNILQSTSDPKLADEILWVDIMDCDDINDLKEFHRLITLVEPKRKHRIVQVLED